METLNGAAQGELPTRTVEAPVQVPPESKLQVRLTTVFVRLLRGCTIGLTVVVPPGGAQSRAVVGGCRAKSTTFRVAEFELVTPPLATLTLNGWTPAGMPLGTVTVKPRSVSLGYGN
jgi:hypothetical protein